MRTQSAYYDGSFIIMINGRHFYCNADITPENPTPQPKPGYTCLLVEEREINDRGINEQQAARASTWISSDLY